MRDGNVGASRCPGTVQYAVATVAASPHGVAVHTRVKSYPHPVPSVAPMAGPHGPTCSWGHKTMPAPVHHVWAAACVRYPLHPGVSGVGKYKRVAPHHVWVALALVALVPLTVTLPPYCPWTSPTVGSAAKSSHERHAWTQVRVAQATVAATTRRLPIRCGSGAQSDGVRL